MREGIESELAGIALGDERLNKRSVQVLKALASDPQASINAACDGWGDTVAAYRLFNNPSVAPEKVLAPHFEATRTLELKQTPKRAARQAKIEIRALRVTMQSPRDRRDSSLPPADLAAMRSRVQNTLDTQSDEQHLLKAHFRWAQLDLD